MNASRQNLASRSREVVNTRGTTTAAVKAQKPEKNMAEAGRKTTKALKQQTQMKTQKQTRQTRRQALAVSWAKATLRTLLQHSVPWAWALHSQDSSAMAAAAVADGVGAGGAPRGAAEVSFWPFSWSFAAAGCWSAGNDTVAHWERTVTAAAVAAAVAAVGVEEQKVWAWGHADDGQKAKKTRTGGLKTSTERKWKNPF